MLKSVLPVLFVVSICAIPSFGVEKSITSEIHDAKGALIGHIKATQEIKGVTFIISVNKDSGLTAGLHGIHIHSVGKCEGPNFTSSGGHFAFEGQMHGMDNPKGPHLGDMPNLRIKKNGSGKLKFHSDLVTLHEGENSLRKPGGTSIVIHAKQDDQKTNPSGNSGDRVACAILFP